MQLDQLHPGSKRARATFTSPRFTISICDLSKLSFWLGVEKSLLVIPAFGFSLNSLLVSICVSPPIVRHLREHGKFLKYAATTVANCSLEPGTQMLEDGAKDIIVTAIERGTGRRA